MSENVSTDKDLDEFLGARPEKPWRKWVVRGAVGLTRDFFRAQLFGRTHAERQEQESARDPEQEIDREDRA